MKQKIKSENVTYSKFLIVFFIVTLLTGISACNQKRLVSSREKIYEQVEQMPEFPGGDLALRKYVAEALRYPVHAQENGIQGKVLLGFVIAKNGLVVNANVERSADPLLDAEALRVVNSMPKWKPGKEKGKKVAVHFTFPINFALE